MGFILLMLSVKLVGIYQDTTPIYSLDNLNIRYFLVLHNDYKLLVDVQAGTRPLLVMLMNKENLVVDTLGMGSMCYACHALANNLIIGEYHHSTMLLRAKNEKLININNYTNCSSGGLGYIDQFFSKVVDFVQIQL